MSLHRLSGGALLRCPAPLTHDIDARLNKFFAEVDAEIAAQPHPDFSVYRLGERILHNAKCKRYLLAYTRKGNGHLKAPSYSVFDLEEIDAGLRSRLATAEAAAEASRAASNLRVAA